MANPLILTLLLDEDSTAFFEARRQAYFPKDRNRVPAHLTLFNALPGAELARIEDVLADLAGTTAPVPLTVSGLRLMGAGVAYEITSPELVALRRGIAREFADALTGQDGQPFRPHVTIQNKVPPRKARELHETLSAFFTPFAATGEGLALWHYRGGPWEPAATFVF